MEFSVSRADLVRELALARGAVEVKTTIPILSNILIETGEDCIHITATDLELAIRCSCPATVTQAGSSTIPAKRLLDYIRLLPDADVQVKVKTGDNDWASLSCERSKARVAGLGRANFPDLPATPTIACIFPLATLADAISKTSFAISKEESRFTLNGAMMILRDNLLTVCATDGHRLALCTAAVEIPDYVQIKWLVPRKAMAELLNLSKASPDATVAVAEDDNHLFFRVGHRTLLARKLAGNFPDYERVLPQDQPLVATVSREDLRGALDRVAQFSDERSKKVNIAIADSEIKVHGATVAGESEETATVEYSGTPIEIGFNATYLTDFLRATECEQVRLMLKDSGSAGELRPVGDDSYRCVIMPMRG